eukprot:5832232-Prymnesium_polylepis.2
MGRALRAALAWRPHRRLPLLFLLDALHRVGPAQVGQAPHQVRREAGERRGRDDGMKNSIWTARHGMAGCGGGSRV